MVGGTGFYKHNIEFIVKQLDIEKKCKLASLKCLNL